ncbi:MAG: hypothetical protein ACFFCQ_10945 [Promethearchaeota archaeon]
MHKLSKAELLSSVVEELQTLPKNCLALENSALGAFVAKKRVFLSLLLIPVNSLKKYLKQTLFQMIIRIRYFFFLKQSYMNRRIENESNQTTTKRLAHCIP